MLTLTCFSFTVTPTVGNASRYICHHWNADDFDVLEGSYFYGPTDFAQPHCEKTLGYQWVGQNSSGTVPIGCRGKCQCCKPLTIKGKLVIEASYDKRGKSTNLSVS